ncbi:MAG: DUF3618 domain-containing protein [Geodermatophilaceae bacterium]
MSRDPKQIQAEIDKARYALAGTLDEIAYRTSPKKLKGDAQSAVKDWLSTPQGQAAMGVVAALIALRVVGKIRRSRRSH